MEKNCEKNDFLDEYERFNDTIIVFFFVANKNKDRT